MRCGMKMESVMNCASMSWSDWGLSMPLRASTRPVFPSEETSRLEWPRNIVGAANRSKTARWGCFCPTLARLRHTLLDREHSLPRHWVEDRGRGCQHGIGWVQDPRGPRAYDRQTGGAASGEAAGLAALACANWHKRATALRLGMCSHLTPMAR